MNLHGHLVKAFRAGRDDACGVHDSESVRAGLYDSSRILTVTFNDARHAVYIRTVSVL